MLFVNTGILLTLPRVGLLSAAALAGETIGNGSITRSEEPSLWRLRRDIDGDARHLLTSLVKLPLHRGDPS
jgi:hypothetical protein